MLLATCPDVFRECAVGLIIIIKNVWPKCTVASLDYHDPWHPQHPKVPWSWSHPDLVASARFLWDDFWVASKMVTGTSLALYWQRASLHAWLVCLWQDGWRDRTGRIFVSKRTLIWVQGRWNQPPRCSWRDHTIWYLEYAFDIAYGRLAIAPYPIWVGSKSRSRTGELLE